jgi:hypothetical protein
MADEQEVVVAETPEVVEAAQEKPEASDVEARARRMGWRPKDEYGGNPDRWVDAEKFIAKGENELPVLRERLRKLDGQLAETQSDLKSVLKLQREQIERAVKKERERLQAEKREAIRAGDEARVDQIDAELAEAKAPVEERPKNEVPPEFVEWGKANPWFAQFPDMNAAAVGWYETLSKQRPDLTDTQKLRLISAEARKRYPERFPAQNKAPSAVQGSNGTHARPKAKGWGDLPTEVRQVAERLVSRGDTTKEQYLKDYAWE